MSAAIIFAFSIVLPNLVLMGLGFFMRRRGDISKPFIDEASKMVFNYALPCLLFFSVVDSHGWDSQLLTLVGAGVVVTFILFLGAELYAKLFITNPADKGVFVQGVFRSNMAILGLATVANAYGEKGLSIGAVYMGIITILFNVLAVITLSRDDIDNKQSKQSEIKAHDKLGVNTISGSDVWSYRCRRMTDRMMTVFKKLVSNPLIISLIAAFIYKGLDLPQPIGVVAQTGELLAAIALPLALICAGATINIKSMLHPSGLSMQASIGRIFIAPLVAVAIGLVFQLPPIHMGVLFLMVSSPTAAASYVMAKAMGGNEVLAANILAFTTVVSLFVMAIGSGVLRAIGWM